MALQWTFLGAFLLGLILAVRYMIIGVEKASRSAPPGPPAVAAFRGPRESTAEYRTRVALPAIAGFAAAFGLVGYALTRLTAFGPVARLVLASAAGLIGAGAAVALILVPEILEQVTVTAERTGERELQKIPMAVSVLSGARNSRRRASDLRPSPTCSPW